MMLQPVRARARVWQALALAVGLVLLAAGVNLAAPLPPVSPERVLGMALEAPRLIDYEGTKVITVLRNGRMETGRVHKPGGTGPVSCMRSARWDRSGALPDGCRLQPRSVFVGVCFGEFRSEQECLRRVVDPEQQDDQSARRTIARGNGAAAEIPADEGLADRK